MIANLREMIDNKSLIGQTMGSYTVSDMDDFSYTDTIDNSLSQRQVGFRGHGNDIFVPLNRFWPLRGEGVST